MEEFRDAITNIQVKPHSAHDPIILKGIFIGREQYLQDEIEFLEIIFTENGYEEREFRKWIDAYRDATIKMKVTMIYHQWVYKVECNCSKEYICIPLWKCQHV